MSRTYRSNPRSTWGEYDYGHAYDQCFYNDAGEVVYRWPRPYEGWLSKGGWKEAKRLLTPMDYKRLRAERGDCFTGYIRNASVPWWFRNEMERQLRQHTAREIHRYKRQTDYEPMALKKYPGIDWYYW